MLFIANYVFHIIASQQIDEANINAQYYGLMCGDYIAYWNSSACRCSADVLLITYWISLASIFNVGILLIAYIETLQNVYLVSGHCWLHIEIIFIACVLLFEGETKLFSIYF